MSGRRDGSVCLLKNPPVWRLPVRLRSAVVTTMDSDSLDPGSIPGVRFGMPYQTSRLWLCGKIPDVWEELPHSRVGYMLGSDPTDPGSSPC